MVTPYSNVLIILNNLGQKNKAIVTEHCTSWVPVTAKGTVSLSFICIIVRWVTKSLKTSCDSIILWFSFVGGSERHETRPWGTVPLVNSWLCRWQYYLLYSAAWINTQHPPLAARAEIIVWDWELFRKKGHVMDFRVNVYTWFLKGRKFHFKIFFGLAEIVRTVMEQQRGGVVEGRKGGVSA